MQGNPGIVTCTDDQVAFSDGMHVVFSGVQGMTELNNHQPFKIKVIGEKCVTGFGSIVVILKVIKQ